MGFSTEFKYIGPSDVIQNQGFHLVNKDLLKLYFAPSSVLDINILSPK